MRHLASHIASGYGGLPRWEETLHRGWDESEAGRRVRFVLFFAMVEQVWLNCLESGIPTCARINVCKQPQPLFRDKGAEFENEEFENAAWTKGLHLATSPAHQPNQTA